MVESKLDMVRLAGSPYDMGRTHGVELGDRIEAFLEIIMNQAMETIPGFSKERALAHARLYIPFIEKYAPHLGEEIRGIAEGAKISVDEAHLLQLRAEVTQLILEDEELSEGCTAFALPRHMTADGDVWMGQNLDLTPCYKDFGVMLQIHPEKGPAILCYTQVGTLGHAGVNSAGLGLMVNALYSSGWKPGIPRPVVYRSILEKEGLKEALDIVVQAQRASSCNYVICHKSGEIADVEVTPEEYGVIGPQNKILVHANHFEHAGMVPFEKRPADKLENSQFRVARLKQLVSEWEDKISLREMKRFLTDHERYPTAICTHPENNPWNFMTIASIIAQPAEGSMHVSLEQGCKNRYVMYSITS
jgi:predicted choloylglycine hydrolase